MGAREGVYEGESSVNVTIQPLISLTIDRCWTCGRYVGVENRNWRCPYCAASKADEAENLRLSMQRTISALRGALTKAKRR